MTLPSAITLIGAVIKIGNTAVDDSLMEMALTLKREVASVKTFGGTVSASGALSGSGSIKAVYDETSGAPYQLLEDELITPTAGGLAIVFQPKGTTSGNKQYTFNIVVGEAKLPSTPDDVASGEFSFETTGAITKAAQTT